MNTLFLRLGCLVFLTVMALRCDAGNLVDPDPAGTPPDGPLPNGGTITGTVTAGGAPLAGVLIGLFPISMTAMTDDNGTFRLERVPLGEYTVHANPEGTSCEPAIALLEEGGDDTAFVDIVCQAAGGILVQVQSSLGNPIPALVTARGPVSREATVPLEDPPAEAGARFADLPPGEYVLTATTPFRTCQSVTITVQVARVASAQIVCDGDPAELAKAFSGDWSFSVLLEDDFGSPLYSQVGGCPPLLNGQPVEGSIAIDAGGGTVSIVGLDPEVTIVGDFEGSWPASGRETRGFSGSGAAARADGSSIQSEVNGSFGFWDGDAPIFFYLDGRMTRKHLDSHGKLVCTERYPVGGDRILFP